MMDVPFTDIYVDDDIVDRVSDVLRSKRYVKGPELEAFEEEFAAECGVEHAVGVSNGTAALFLSLRAAGIGDGDDVFVPGHTFFASASPILQLGANPVFVGIDEETYTLDPDALVEAVDEADNPQAVLPVHIYGQMADMERITAIADERDLTVVEDACQAHFAERDDHTAGAVGDVGAFSFYPSKNMTVAGDGGMLVTDDDEIAEHARAIRNHGRNPDGEHVHLGLNYRLDEVSAAVGREQLKHIREWNEGRNAAAQRYTEQLSDAPEVTTPSEAEDAYHVYHLYVIRVPDRDELQTYLENEGVDTGIHYATPAHEHESVVEHIGETSLPFVEQFCDEILSLPMHPRISDDEVDEVCSLIEGYYR